jgi:hypothetical protein
VLETFGQTEYPTLLHNPAAEPERVIPINIYYHFFSGSRIASLQALREVYDGVLKRGNLAPLYTSEYLDMVQGFFTMELSQTDAYTWTIENGGACRTLRFDHDTRTPDLKRSRGILGWSRWEKHLYVYLDGSPRCVLALASTENETPHLAHAAALLRHWKQAANTLEFEGRSFGTAPVELAGLIPGSGWSLHVEPLNDLSGQRSHSGTLQKTQYADMDGHLTFTLTPAGNYQVKLAQVTH